MTCRCGESRRTEAKHTFRRTVAGNTFTAETTVDACAGCGEPHVPAALIIAFERAVATELARRGPVSGETFRWIRKAAALERVDLSQLLALPVETIAAWEEERRPTDVAAWTVVAAIALDALEGPRPLRTRIKARRRGPPAPNEITPLAIDTASAGTLAKVLELLVGPIAFTDADIADALDVDCAVLRARLRDLAVLGLIHHGSAHDDAFRWDPVSRDRAALLRAAAEAGVDLDAPLPRAKHSEGRLATPHGRVTPVTWRAAT
jgi:DNA-binding transcriptional regulator YiaG